MGNERNFEPNNLGRRTFLRKMRNAGLTLLLAGSIPVDAACSFLASSPDIRRTEGTWTQEEVERVAQSMMRDEQFRFTYRAGRILFGNQRGENSVSSDRKVFSDTFRVILETHKGKLPREEGFAEGIIEPNAPMDALIQHNQPFYNFTLKGKPGTPDELLLGSDSLRLGRIRISKQLMDGKSDFLFKLLLAKEVQNINAFDVATDTLLTEVYKNYEIPSDNTARRIMRTASINREVNGVPMSAIGDIWAHFIILPDYLLAKDRNMLTLEDQKGLWMLETSASILTELGGLEKKSDESYGWVGTDAQLIRTWYKAADAGYKAVFQHRRQ